MKKKFIIPAFALIALAIALITAFSVYQKHSRYTSALNAFNSGDYAEAEKGFSNLSGYKDSDDFLMECQYQNAIADIESGDYEKALTAFEFIEDYKDSQGYIEKALFGRKYAMLNDGSSADISPARLEVLLTSPEEVESALESNFYEIWYDCNTGEKLPFDRYQLNGNDYGVKEASDIDGYISLTCYYMDNPDYDISVSIEYDYFNYIDIVVDRLYIYDENVGATSYYLITPEEYDELVAQDEEAMNSQPNYSDATIIEKTFSAFKNQIRSYYSGPSTLYHTSSYSDAYVSYDWETKTYTCTMTAEYSTNGFDFWGTSTQTYFVTAQFLDTGSNLTMTDFSAY